MSDVHSTMQDWFDRMADRYAEEQIKGLHDDACEWRRNHYLCHCSKRAREAEGFTEPPRIWLRAPTCTKCYDDVSCDGDQWCCYTCKTVWPLDANDEQQGTFTDDYGTLEPPDAPRA